MKVTAGIRRRRGGYILDLHKRTLPRVVASAIETNYGDYKIVLMIAVLDSSGRASKSYGVPLYVTNPGKRFLLYAGSRSNTQLYHLLDWIYNMQSGPRKTVELVIRGVMMKKRVW